MKIAIYSRKSVYTGKGESIENQIKICKEYVLTRPNAFPIEDESDFLIFRDEGFSGKNFSRPEFQNMMKLVRAKKVDCIVCYRLDRISRSVSDFAPLMEELNKVGVAFISVNEQFDTSTSMGRAMILMSSVFAQLERETIAERIKDSYYQLAQTGRWLGGNVPLGYSSTKKFTETIDGKRKQSTHLMIDENEIKTVRLIFDKYLEYRSLVKVADYLYSIGIRAKSGKGHTGASIRDILLNPVYCKADEDIYDYLVGLGATVCMPKERFNGENGLIANYRRDYSKKNAPRLTMDKWMFSVGQHQGILSGKEWLLVLHYLNLNQKNTVRTAANRNEYALLSGKIICKKCGNRLFAKMSSYKDSFYYICSGKRHEAEFTNGERCTCENLPGKETDKLVLDMMLSYRDVKYDWEKIIHRISDRLNNETLTKQLDLIEESIDERYAKIKQYTDQILSSGLNQMVIDEINRRVENISKEITDLEIKRKEILLQIESDYKTIAEDYEIFLALIAYLNECKESLSMEKKRELIDVLLDRIEWNGENVDIFVYGQP